MHKIYLFVISFLFVFTTFSQNVVWNFGTSAANGNPSTNSATNVIVSAVTRGNNTGSTTFLETTSPSSGYTGVSGLYNGAAAAKTGSLSTASTGSTYFEFTLTPDANYTVQLTDLKFGIRSTGTGPANYALRSSSDAYASNIVIGTIATDGNWSLKTNSGITTTSGTGTAITFRIYGYGGSGTVSANNWRIDDLSLTLNSSTNSTTPTITLNTTSFSGAFGNVNVGASSAVSSFTVSGSNLTSDITVMPPSAGGFEIRTGSNAFSTASIIIPQSSGSVAATTIDARFTPTATGAQSGNITVSSTSATDKTVAVSGTGVQPTKLAITAISPTSPTVNSAFSVTVQSQDANGTATNVLAATSFSLSVNMGNGTLGGTITGTIAAGSNQVVVSGVTYNTAESGVLLTATRTAGDMLTAGNSAAFTVVGVATQLAFVNFPTSGSANANIASFTVEARRADNSVDAGFTGSITLSKASGSGNVSGTLTKAAVAGVATFNDIKFDAADTYTLTSASSGLTAGTSPSITISAAASVPAIGEILINQMSPDYNGASDEYVELVNTTNKTFDLSTVSLRYQSSGGTPNSSTGATPLSGIMAPNSYWLLSPNTSITVGLTTGLVRDGGFTAGFGSSGGQIAIVRVSDNALIDAVGYGTGTSGIYTEGSPAPATPNDGGIRRVTDGVDNNTNSTDFTTVANGSIDLKNSASRISNTGATVAAGTYNRLYITGNSSLGGTVTLTGRLVFSSNAVLTTSTSNTLRLTATTSVTGASATSYVSGPLVLGTASTTAKTAPVGKSGVYNPVTITPTTTAASEFTTEYFAAAPPTAPIESRLSAIQTNEYWQVDRTSGTSPATVTLNYNSANATWSNGMNPTVSDVIGIVHLRSGSNTWTQEAGTTVPSNTTTATLTSAAVTDFSPFTFGYGPTAVLPVSIVSFTGAKTTNGNVLNWKVADESNFKQYVVERRISNTDNFQIVSTVAGNNAGSYTSTDAQPTGYNYYRLKLVDRDGKSSYSKTILIINQAKGFEVTNVYPTITTGTVVLESYAASPVKATLKLVNQIGQVVFTQAVFLNQSTLTNLNLSHFAKGNYLLQVSAEGYSKTVKLIKQ